ncbi:MAG: MOSC domain-containing protein [Chthoniobacterales bacterium]|nr:MOSC domain-containing protein [Chthoniobacterales bacterium]
MKLLSVNVGLPRAIEWGDKLITTGIFKEPVKGPVWLETLNLVGDRQADLTVHGGVSKAVYAYPSEHYEFWKYELPGVPLPFGVFGENFTLKGLLEESANIGDRFRIGEAEVMVTEPRMPCYKLGIRVGRPDMVKRFSASRRSGFYLAVTREGMVKAGDAMAPLDRDDHGITVADVIRLRLFEQDDFKTLQRAVEVEALPEDWRHRFRQQLEKYAS